MSGDVLLLPLPADIASIDDLPADHEPPPVGSRSDVRAALEAAVPGVDLTDPARGELLGPAGVIELNIGEDDPVESVMLHVRGGTDDVLPMIFRIARALGCRPFDRAGDLLADGDAAGWHAFRAFRDRALSSGPYDIP
ncbi:hypothetical protein [Streptomyces sp. cmx-10-25]|uniref:hypothetical protein n=1 Tax=Streptomyces sp. cmx-10-25 TaxID=2790919 RepID=UPI0039813E26